MTESSAEPKRHVRAGQIVRSDSGVGITTDEPMKRTPRISVMFVGGSWPVAMQLDELTVLEEWPQ